MTHFPRSSPTPTTDQLTRTPIQHPPLFERLGKRHRSPDSEPAPISKMRRLSLYNRSLGGSSRALIRDTSNEPKTIQLRPLKFRPRGMLLNAILSNGEGTLVLLITLKTGPRVLKLYPPPIDSRRYCFGFEHDAYAVLEKTHYSGSVAPHCYGCITTIDMDGLLGAFHSLTPKETADLQSTHFARACPKGTLGRALLIQYIPGTSALDCAMVTGDIIKKAEDGLKDLHRRGVVHGDPAPRNLLITEDNDIVWIDYDMAITTRTYEIEDGCFLDEFTRMRREFGVN